MKQIVLINVLFLNCEAYFIILSTWKWQKSVQRHIRDFRFWFLSECKINMYLLLNSLTTYNHLIT